MILLIALSILLANIRVRVRGLAKPLYSAYRAWKLRLFDSSYVGSQTVSQ
jgi:hypothetical protein